MGAPRRAEEVEPDAGLPAVSSCQAGLKGEAVRFQPAVEDGLEQVTARIAKDELARLRPDLLALQVNLGPPGIDLLEAANERRGLFHGQGE